MSIKVIVAGFKGRMGSTAVEMVKGDDELTLAALLDPFAAEKEVDGVPVFTDKADLVGFDADVWVDFTTPSLLYGKEDRSDLFLQLFPLQPHQCIKGTVQLYITVAEDKSARNRTGLGTKGQLSRFTCFA